MPIVAAAVTAVMFSLSSPLAEPVEFAAFFTDDAPAACENAAKALNDAEPEHGRRFYCE